MSLVPNQRQIKINKEKCNINNLYTIINLEALKNAMFRLNGNELKFWIYLAKNQDKYTFALSKVDTLKWCHFSESTYSKVFNKLVEYGYLIESSSNHYNFYEIPQVKEDNPIITINKVIINNK